MGSAIGDQGEHFHDESGHRALAVDAKKKVLEASERKEEERRQWREDTKERDASKFVFLDESGSNIALTRLYGRAPKGKRARGSLPRNRGKNMTLISSRSPSRDRGVTDFGWSSQYGGL